MAVTVAKYTFGSWLRKGIANNINEVDNLGLAASSLKERTTVAVDISVNTQPIHKDFSLLGPGDVVGINPNQVVRTEPRHWVTDFEPNYFPFIEYYDEDFAWRYTPAKPNGAKHRPWIALIVLKQTDDEAGTEFTLDQRRIPLPVVTIKLAASLPPVSQLWAWSHVQTNEGYNADSEFEEFLQSLHDLNNPNADKIICRLICPRRLEANSAYHAFVVPTFETGRLAGLGLDTKDVDAQQAAWADDSNGIEMPYYHDWFFRTGENEDFESLVKLLEPRAVDERVGIRDMNGSQPGFGMHRGTDLGLIPNAENQMIIGLEGALKTPTTVSRPANLDIDKLFFGELETILNRAANVLESDNTQDPVVGPPIYGENHAETHEIDISLTGWLHGLNKDPRLRVPSGFGTNVVKKNQEDYMARAWAQVEKILQANKKILFAVFSMNVALQIKKNFISKLPASKMITFLSPLLTKVKGSPTTLFAQMRESNLPVASVSAAFRKIVRPRGVIAKKLKAADGNFSHQTLLQDLNAGKVSPAPPRITPKGLDTLDNFVKDFLSASSVTPWQKWLVNNKMLVLIILLMLAVVLGFGAGIWIAMAVGIAVAVALYRYASRIERLIEQPKVMMNDPVQLVEMIKKTPPRPSFTFTETEPLLPPISEGDTQVTYMTETSGQPGALKVNVATYRTRGTSMLDNLEAKNFRHAALKLNERMSIMAPEVKRKPFDMSNAKTKLNDAVDPMIVYPKQLASLVYLSFSKDWLLKPQNLVQVMAYPDFEDPMYEKLRDISSELLIPNLDLIPPNTMSLLVTNPEFIEAYMVGLNHEFGKELLWRSYPTDRRGSYFRQFWDVRGIITSEPTVSKEALTEKYKDITPIHSWVDDSKLGSHNNRGINKPGQLVLVVRGDLLKRYPNTIIYAQKAHLFKRNGVSYPNLDPMIVEVETEDQMKAEIKFPLFKAEIDPDLKFFGFDLTIAQARGSENPQAENDDWGYYFVIQQIPGEPRFGMDIQFDPDSDDSTPITWDDMSWEKYDNAERFINTSVMPDASFVPAGVSESRSQWGSSAAAMAYILYQKPVMIAVHAKKMLKGL